VGLPVAGAGPGSADAAGTFALYSTNQLDAIVDVMGYWAPSNTSSSPGVAGELTLVDPVRTGGTRTRLGPPLRLPPRAARIAPAALNPGETRRFLLAGRTFSTLTLPPDVKGIMANVTIVQGGPSGGFLTAFPGDVPDAGRPNASTVNPATAIAASFWANGIPVAPAANPGTGAIFSTNPLDVVVDVVAYFR